MKNTYLEFKGIKVRFDVSNLELTPKGSKLVTDYRAYREFTVKGKLQGITFYLENVSNITEEYRATDELILNYNGEKYIEHSPYSKVSEVSNTNGFSYIRIDTLYDDDVMILFCKKLNENVFLIISVNGIADYEELFNIGKRLMENLEYNEIETT